MALFYTNSTIQTNTNVSNTINLHQNFVGYLFLFIYIFIICFCCKIIQYIINKLQMDINIHNVEDRYDSIPTIQTPRLKYTKSEADDDECTICLEKHDSSSFVVLECGHMFHKKCIEKWASERYRSFQTIICPLCKNTMY